MDSNIFLAKSLKKLGFAIPVALLASTFSSTSLAAFSPIDQPLESDFFVGAGSDAVAGSFDTLGISAPEDGAAGIGLTQVFVGKNLVNQGGFVGGVLAHFAKLDVFASFAQSGVFAQKPVGKEIGVGAYVTYKSDSDDHSGLKLGLLAGYARSIDEPTVAGADVPHGIGISASQAYTVNLADIGDHKVLFSEFAEANAHKRLDVTDAEIAFSSSLGLKLATNFGNFVPFISASVYKGFSGSAKTDGFFPLVGGGFSWKPADQIALKFDLSKTMGDVQLAKAGLGVEFLF